MDRCGVRTNRFKVADLYKISNDSRQALRLTAREVSKSDSYLSEGTRGPPGRRRRSVGRTRDCFRPRAIDLVGVGGEPGVIAEKRLLCFKQRIRPCIVGERPA